MRNFIKLPQTLQNHQSALKFTDYLAKISKRQAFLSYLLYRANNKYYFIYKDENFPFIPFDWTLYSVMRSIARTMVTSGPTLRTQYFNYNDDIGTFGRPDICQIFKDNFVSPCKLFVISKAMSEDQIRNIASKKYFEYVPTSKVASPQASFKQVCTSIASHSPGPILFEFGQTIFEKSIAEVKEDEDSFLDMISLSLMEGPLPQKYIGRQYDMSIIDRDFKLDWESQSISSTSGQVNQIQLRLAVYLKKQKNMKSK